MAESEGRAEGRGVSVGAACKRAHVARASWRREITPREAVEFVSQEIARWSDCFIARTTHHTWRPYFGGLMNTQRIQNTESERTARRCIRLYLYSLPAPTAQGEL